MWGEGVRVRSEDHLADALTKPMDAVGIQRHIEGIGAVVSKTRRPLTPKLEHGKEEEEMEVWDENN